MIISQSGKVDLIPEYNRALRPIFCVSEGDADSRMINLTVQNAGENFTIPESAAVYVAGRKKDNTIFTYQCMFSGYIVTFPVSAQMSAEDGIVLCEIKIVNDGEPLGSANFVYWVEPSPVENGTASESDLNIMTQAIEAVSNIDAMEAELDQHITDEVAERVAEMHILPGQVVIDGTLSVPGAAAEAEVTGKKAANLKSVSDYIANNIAAGGYSTKVDNLYINTSNKKFASTANALSVIVFPIEPNTKYTVHKSTATVTRVATGMIASPVSGDAFTREVHHDSASSDPLTIVSGRTDTYMYIQLFNNADAEDLKSVAVNMETLLIYEDKTGMVETELSDIEYGEITLPTGVAFAGFYPKADGTIGANTSSRMAVFPVKDGVTYLVSWLTGANMYRTAFGNTAPEDIAAGTPIYGFVDNASTSHTKYPRTNDNNCDYLYIYIGNSAAATIDSIKVSAKIKTDIDGTLASEGDAW